MAFRMNRPIIKGTAKHKASIAKAKSESIVSQSRTTADRSLVDAYSTLGESKIPQAMDYSFDMPEIKIPKGKKKKVEKKKEKKEYDARGKYEMDPNQLKDRPLVEDPLLPEEDAKEIPGDSEIQYGWEDTDVKEVKPKKRWGKKVGDFFTNAFGEIRDASGRLLDKIEAKKAKNEIKYQEQQKEKERIQEEKDAKFIGKGEKEDTTVSYEDSKEYKQYQKEQEKIAAEAKRKQMRKKEVIEVGKPTLDAFGGKAIANYNEEQKERLNTEGVFSEDAGRVVLPEEIVDGKFVSQATEDILVESKKVDELKTDEVSLNVKPPERKTVKKPRESKYKWPSGAWKYKGKEKYETDLQDWQQSQSPAEMRDDRIWRNAIKGGRVHKNMRKSGYTPPSER
mgnify:CR=1 FL=1